MTFDANKPNPSINREQVAPVLSEQGKQEGEMEKPGTEVYQSWAGDSSADARKEGAGKPKGTPDTDKNLVDAGTSTAGDGSADGGINSGEGREPKSRSKL